MKSSEHNNDVNVIFSIKLNMFCWGFNMKGEAERRKKSVSFVLNIFGKKNTFCRGFMTKVKENGEFRLFIANEWIRKLFFSYSKIEVKSVLPCSVHNTYANGWFAGQIE